MTSLLDLLHALKAARTDTCRLHHARALVRGRFEAGLYPMIAVLSADILEYMAKALCDEAGKEG